MLITSMAFGLPDTLQKGMAMSPATETPARPRKRVAKRGTPAVAPVEPSEAQQRYDTLVARIMQYVTEHIASGDWSRATATRFLANLGLQDQPLPHPWRTEVELNRTYIVVKIPFHRETSQDQIDARIQSVYNGIRQNYTGIVMGHENT
jgi:hypothetical protein